MKWEKHILLKTEGTQGVELLYFETYQRYLSETMYDVLIWV